MKGIVVEKMIRIVYFFCQMDVQGGKNHDELQIGSVFYINSTQRSTAFYLKKAASMVAAILLVAFLGLGAYSWTIPVQYINIDINPSVELVINRYNRIIRQNPLNDDGEKLLESVDLQLQKYEKGVHAVIETAKSLGYLADERDVLISISSSDSDLRQKTQEEIKKKVPQKAEVMVFDSAEHDRSVREGLSPGKSRMIGKVMESGTNLTEEELAAAPVKDLMLRVKENKKMNQELEKEAKHQEKLRKEQEKAAQKENRETVGDQKGNQDKDSNKPVNAGKEDDKPKGSNNAPKGKQEDEDSSKREDKPNGNSGKNENNGNNKPKDKDGAGRNETEDNANPSGRKENAKPGTGKQSDKSQGEDSKNKPSTGAGDKTDDQQLHNGMKEKEKGDGNQPADKKNNKDDKTKQKGNADRP